MIRSRSSLISPMLGAAAMLVALYTILLGGVPALDAPDAERNLADIASHLGDEAAARGREVRMQYSGVTINGFAYEKWARISKLSIDLLYQQWQGRTRLGLSTETADLLPDNANPHRHMLRFGDVINLISNSELLALITPSQPITYAITYKVKDAPGAVRHRLTLPAGLDILRIADKAKLQLAFAKPIIGEALFFKQQRQLRAKLLSESVSLIGPQGAWSVANSETRLESIQKSPSVIESKGTLTLDQLSFAKNKKATVPYTLTSAWVLKSQRNISGAVDASQLEIKHGLFTNGAVKISLNGTMHFDIDDAAYGDVVLEISNPAEFLRSGWIAPDKRAEAEALLGEIMGDTVDMGKQVIIPIERAKNGQWRVGKMPLDALLDKQLLDLFIFTAKDDQHEKQESNPAPAS